MISRAVLIGILAVFTAAGRVCAQQPGTATGQRARWVADEVIVKFRQTTPNQEKDRLCRKHGGNVFYTSPFAGFRRIKLPAGLLPQQAVERFRNEPAVEYAERNFYAYAFAFPNDPYYSIQWNFHAAAGVNAPGAWQITTGDPSVIIAVLDTGAAYQNYNNFILAPDLAGTLFVPGWDFVNNDSHPNDDEGHGTHVTGTIAQTTNNAIGAAGIAFNCSIMPVKVLNKRGKGTYADIADGIYYAADHDAKVINMSLGGASDSTTLRNAVAYAYQNGVTVVCAAGNEYEEGNPTTYPAAYNDYCIAVGATRYDLTRAHYSNTGSWLDLAAPGGDLDVDQNGDGYKDGIIQQTFGKSPSDMGYWLYEGTSMATPHVSAAAGLLASIGITSPDAICQALEQSARDLGAAGRDNEFGYGLIDIRAALKYFPGRGDYNADGSTDAADLERFMQFWLDNDPVVDVAPNGGDGIVNVEDFAVFAANWSGA